MSDGPTTLYRLFSDDGALLYVGIAGNPGRRFEQHRKDKPWWGQVAEIKLEHFQTRTAALTAETAAIKAERPRHNVVGNRGNHRTVTPSPGWSFASLKSGYRRDGVELVLEWDANGAAHSYDMGFDDPHEAFDEWVNSIKRHDKNDSHKPIVNANGWVHLTWYVASTNEKGVFEMAPRQHFPASWMADPNFRAFADDCDFLRHFTWPVDRNGQFLSFTRLPVTPCKSWFITDATGFKPGPMQPALHLPTLLENYRREQC
jgi:predicted GIY-YIG superfamily endonuclease